MVEQVGIRDLVLVEVTRAQRPLDSWIFAVIMLAVVLGVIFIYYKIKK